MIDVVAFDADDTLWHCENRFQETQARLIEILDRHAPHSEVEAKLHATERRNVRLFGYGVKGFTLSMIETAIEISGHRVTAAEIHEIMMMGKALLDAPLDLFEGVAEVLDRVGASRELLLITKGDLLDQTNKIAKSGLADRFAHIEVLTDKSVAAYRRLFGARNVAPERVAMVGNSLPSDILPVLEIGGHAVHIPYAVTAAFERHDEAVEHPRLHRLRQIGELPGLIERLDWREDRTIQRGRYP